MALEHITWISMLNSIAVSTNSLHKRATLVGIHESYRWAETGVQQANPKYFALFPVLYQRSSHWSTGHMQGLAVLGLLLGQRRRAFEPAGHDRELWMPRSNQSSECICPTGVEQQWVSDWIVF